MIHGTSSDESRTALCPMKPALNFGATLWQSFGRLSARRLVDELEPPIEEAAGVEALQAAPAAARASGQKGPMIGVLPATVVRRSTRRYRA